MIPSNYPSVELATSDGARAVIALDGAHVTSWIPAGETDDRLFVSRRSTYGPGRAIRGGIPVIFPQFGPFGPLPQHGFARISRWQISDAPHHGRVRLSLTDTPETRVVWPHAFALEVAVQVCGAALTMAMTVRNTDATAFAFTAAFHPYFAVRDAFAAQVHGLEGLSYRDSLRNGEHFNESAPVLTIDGPMDRIYYNAPDTLRMQDGGRTVRIEKRGFSEAVVWNPGVEGTRSRSDFAEGEEQVMLCVEAARIQHPVQLAPGESWTGVQTMVAE